METLSYNTGSSMKACRKVQKLIKIEAAAAMKRTTALRLNGFLMFPADVFVLVDGTVFDPVPGNIAHSKIVNIYRERD